MSAQCPQYVRTTSHEGYMSLEGDVVRTQCEHCADIYLQGYMSALYPSSVFTSDVKPLSQDTSSEKFSKKILGTSFHAFGSLTHFFLSRALTLRLQHSSIDSGSISLPPVFYLQLSISRFLALGFLTLPLQLQLFSSKILYLAHYFSSSSFLFMMREHL